MWSLDACEWYRKGSPLVKFLANKFYNELRFDAESDPGVLWCSDSNAIVDILKMAHDIETLK